MLCSVQPEPPDQQSPISEFESPISEFESPMSEFETPISDIETPMSDFENYKSRGLFLSLVTLSKSLLLNNNVVFSTA